MTLGANWVIAAFGDGSAPLLETGHPFEPRSDLFGRQAEAIGDGLQAVAGARAFGQGSAGLIESATAISSKDALAAVNLSGRINASGMGTSEAGKFFGWKGNGQIDKPLSAFSPQSLEAAGWTRDRLANVAQGYREIAHITPQNPSAVPRAEQLEAMTRLWK